MTKPNPYDILNAPVGGAARGPPFGRDWSSIGKTGTLSVFRFFISPEPVPPGDKHPSAAIRPTQQKAIHFVAFVTNRYKHPAPNHEHPQPAPQREPIPGNKISLLCRCPTLLSN